MMRDLPGKYLQYLIAAALAYAAFLVLYASYWIINNPAQMDYIEGPVMDAVLRAANNQPIYTEPSLVYTNLMYTPLYYHVTALLGKLIGLNLMTGRLVSLCSTLLSLVIIFLWLRKESCPRLYAIIGAVTYLAFFEAVNRWFLSARVDALFILLLITGFYAYFCHHTRTGALIGGALLALAFFTKQQALIIALPLLCVGMLYDRRHALYASFSFLGLITIGCAYLEWQSAGWFSFAVFEIPATMPKNWGKFWICLRDNILCSVPILLFFSAILFEKMRHTNMRRQLEYASILVGAIIAAIWSRMHPGGAENSLMPLYAVISVTGVLGLRIALQQNVLPNKASYLLLAIQLCLLVSYPPVDKKLLENQGKIAQMQLDYIRNIPGEVFIPDVQFNQTMAGKTSYSFRMNVFDLIRSTSPKSKMLLKKIRLELADSIRNKRFSAIIVRKNIRLFRLQNYYKLKEKIIEYDQASKLFPAQVDTMVSPNYVYIPITDEP